MAAIRIRNILDPNELVRFLIITNIMLFGTALMSAPDNINTSFSPMVFLSPDTHILFSLGSTGSLPVLTEDRWWTLITANYLHGSLLHLLFNLSALYTIGKINIEIFAPSRCFLIYCLGGVISMAASTLAGIPLTLGASGAICALIGSMSYNDWRASKGNLKQRIATVGVWVVFFGLIGLTLPAVNNWAHATGYISGFLLGFCFWPRTTQKESYLIRAASSICMMTTIGTLLYGLLFS